MSSSTSSGPSLSKGGRGKKKPWAPSTSGSSSTLFGEEALAAYAASREATPLPGASTSTARPRTPIFTRPAPPSLKRARSNTSSSLPTIPVEVLAGAHPNTSYFQHLFVKVALETGLGEFNPTPEALIFCQMFRHLHDDYRKAIDGLTEDISALSEELETFRSAPQPAPATSASAPPNPKAPESTSRPAPQQHPPPPPATPAAPAQSWATVARKGRKKAPAPPKPSAPPATTSTSAKTPAPKKGPTMRERRLTIKRDGSPLLPTAIELRDSINKALSATLVQTVSFEGGNVTLTTMDSVKATSLNSKVSAFLHLIPGTTTVHLDSPASQLLVHGIPTSHSLATIATELTTFNTGLALTQQPRWLTSDDSRANKSASTVVISITGPKAPLFIGKRLAAFSSTYRTERRLRFNSFTQCSNCHSFGHHSTKCNNPAACRWCTIRHSTGDHSCPTATCRVRGRPCSHSTVRCVNCGGPHDAHSPTCPHRPARPVSDESEEVVETMSD